MKELREPTALEEQFLPMIIKRQEKAKWTTAELAQRAGLNRATVHRVLTGQQRAGIKVLQALMNATGIGKDQ